VDELVELLSSLADAVYCLFYPCHSVGTPALVLLLKFEKRFDLSAVIHVRFGRGLSKSLALMRQKLYEGLN
jgi:hypothetical protein